MRDKPIRLPAPLMSASRYLIHLISIALLCFAYYAALNGSVDGDPVQYLLDYSGIGAFNLLLASLVISPSAKFLKFGQLMVLRKTLGVYAAVYASFHLYTFIAYELGYEWGLVFAEIVERPYITVGFAAWIILTVLLITSLTTIRKKMGKYWQPTHYFVYLAGVLIALHFLWLVKSERLEPYIYIAILAVLLISRKQTIMRIYEKLRPSK